MLKVSEETRRAAICLTAILVFISFVAVCHAAPTSYKIGSRDILNVSVFAGGVEQVNADLTVSDDGMVNFPFIGRILAKGLTASQLEKSVYVPLEKDFFVEPQIHIQTKGYHSLEFSISGAVKNPGNYEMKSATTLLDLIAKAGGVTPERGNVLYILSSNPGSVDKVGDLQSEENKPKKIKLEKLLNEGDMSDNIILETGSSVYIPLAKGLNQADTKVYVSGEVKKPDVYEYQPGLTALSVCLMAGGFAQYAAPNRTTIVRFENEDQSVIKIDLDEVIKGKAKDIPLKPGDRLHIPESWF
jgi:polysaccharide export outer membrane protein